VQKGLDVQIQQALDTVRVIGNEAVHPGEMDVRDDPSLVGTLYLPFEGTVGPRSM
jgi:hypothetical protein